MIRLENLRKSFHYRGTVKHVARGVTINFPTGKSIALLGRNGAGKSTLLNMLAGAMAPDEGRIVIEGTVSWPVGFQGSFHRDLTGAQNTRFLARVYGIDTDEMTHFVEEFAELGNHFHQPVRSYSSGMRARLGFGCSMAIRFDWYLVDEVTAVGDASFKEKSAALFRDRMEHSSAVFVSHSMGDIRNVCDAAVVLENGSMRYYGNLEEGIAQHEKNMRKGRSA
ncbi:ABC transporter ATP-binding protein [Marinovum sp.]|uniref:ABC transporter ATP-binding protein n=1 Tax=Marinovum sp. TaxID=2024839 RepID=UPI003A8DC9A7